MEFVSVVGRHWRRRRLLALAAVLALAIGATSGVVLSQQGGKHPIAARGAALARVMVDTPEPMAASAGPYGEETVQRRSQLLAEDLTTDESNTAIARGAGVSPRDLEVVGPFTMSAHVPDVIHDPILPERAALAALTAVRAPFRVVIRADVGVPILSIEVTTPDVLSATRLASAAVAALKAAVAPRSRERPLLVVRRLGPVQSAEVHVPMRRDRRRAVLISAVVFALLSFGILIGSRGPAMTERSPNRRSCRATH